MRVQNALGAALLAAACFVACTGRVSLGSPDTSNAGLRSPTSAGGAGAGADAGNGGGGAGAFPVTSGGAGDDASSAPGTNATADAGADGGCASRQFDPHNCGACGHDCMGGACQAGVCVPLPAGALATGQLSPTSIAVDATNVYWVNEGLVQAASSSNTQALGPVQILKCAKTGCNNDPTVLVTDWSDQGNGGRLRGLAADGTNVYWASNSALYACAVGGCNNTPTVLHSTVPPQRPGGAAPEIAAASGTVYASDIDSAYSEPVDAGSSTTLWSLGSGSMSYWMWIGIDDMRAYIATIGGEIVSCALGGCGGAPTRLVSGSTMQSANGFFAQLAVDSANVYWGLGPPPGFYSMTVTHGFVLSCAGTGQLPAGQILECAKGGCGDNPTTLVSGLNCPTGVVTDGASVYFSEPEYWGGAPTPLLGDADVGRIAKCAVTGCSNQATTLADKLNNPHGVAVDASYVYWADFGSGGTVPAPRTTPPPPAYSDDGRIMRIAK